MAITAVEICREGQFILVRPACSQILGRVLATVARAATLAPDGCVRVGRRRQALYTLETHMGRRVLQCWAGLAPVVLAALYKARCEVTPGPLYHRPLLLPRASGRAGLVDLPFLELVARHDRGVIRYASGMVDPVRLVAQASRAWPTTNISVAVSTREQVCAVVRQLRAQGLAAYGFTARNQPMVETCVAVVTFAGLAYNPTEPEKQNLVFVLDAAAATAKEPRYCLQFVTRARLYGFSELGQELSPYDQDRVREIFGFQEALVPRHGHRVRPVEVAWAPGAGQRLRRPGKNIIDTKRYGVWCNDARNRQVARLARACADADAGALAALLPAAARAELPAAPRSVVVLVENVEHVLALAHKLPGWNVVSSGLVQADGLSAGQRTLLREKEPDVLPAPVRAVVTEAGLQSCTLPLDQIDIIVRADGGVGLSGLCQALQASAAPDVPGPLLLIDLDDQHEPELRRRARSRRRAYREQGWAAPGIDGFIRRVSRFLQTRLRGVTP